jgi:nicotinamidase/pyrazinamidase
LSISTRRTFGATLITSPTVAVRRWPHPPRAKKIFPKGTDVGVDSYSGFFDNGHRHDTGMATWLRERGVKELYVLGVATDYCVKFTVLDALGEGFETKLVVDGCRGVNMNEGDVDGAIAAMREAGAVLVDSESVP